MPRIDSGESAPISYQRLMCFATFPDGSPAVISAVVPTQNLNIDGLEVLGKIETTSVDSIEFDDSIATFEQQCVGKGGH
jgi:hypothetical protein